MALPLVGQAVLVAPVPLAQVHTFSVQPPEYAPFVYRGVPVYPTAHWTVELVKRSMNSLLEVSWQVESEFEFE